MLNNNYSQHLLQSAQSVVNSLTVRFSHSTLVHPFFRPGPVLLSLYISLIAYITAAHGLIQQQYADDTRLYVAISHLNRDTALAQLERCLDELHIWFCWNSLSLNPDKTDAILLGTSMRSKTISTLNTIIVAGTPVALSDSIKILGIVLDKKLTFDSHISHVFK